MKNKFLSQLLQFLFFAVVYTGLINYFSKQKNLEGNPRLIEFLSGDPATGRVTLSTRTDSVQIQRGKKVKWAIANNSNIDSFSIIKKSGQDIFSAGEQPPGALCKHGEARVKRDARASDEYQYSIQWVQKNTVPRKVFTFDPKIAINPTNNSVALFISVAAGLVLALLTVLGITTLNNRRRRNEHI